MSLRALIFMLVLGLSTPFAARADTVTLPQFSVAIFDAPDDTPAVAISPGNPYAFSIPGDAPSGGTLYFLNDTFKLLTDFHIRLSTFADIDINNIGPEGPLPLPVPPGRVYVFPSANCYNAKICTVETGPDTGQTYHDIGPARIFGVTYASVPGADHSLSIEIEFTPSVAPEPQTWALMLAGFFGAGAVLRRRRATVAA